MHADAARQSCQQEQDIKEEREDVTRDGHISESEQEDVRQGDEDEAGACVGRYAYAKHRGEYDESAQHGNHRIDDADVHGRTHQPGLVAEVRCVGHQATDADTQREEGLAHGPKYDFGRNLAQVGFQQEADAFACAWHHQREADQEHDYHEKHGHHEFRVALDAVPNASGHHEVRQEEEHCNV